MLTVGVGRCGGDRPVGCAGAERGRSGNVRLQQRDALCPLPLAVDDLTARLETGRLELVRQILDGLRLTCR